MLEFNSKGLLIPNTMIESSVDELKECLVDNITSKTRLEIFNKYLAYSNSLKVLLGVVSIKQWINGSFVTKIANPRDIDLVSFVDYKLVEKVGDKLIAFNKEAIEDKMLDTYFVVVYPKGHSKEIFYSSDLAYWIDRFDTTRRDRKGIKNNKGFLEIIY